LADLLGCELAGGGGEVDAGGSGSQGYVGSAGGYEDFCGGGGGYDRFDQGDQGCGGEMLFADEDEVYAFCG
jgi:hypothetical protein